MGRGQFGRIRSIEVSWFVISTPFYAAWMASSVGSAVEEDVDVGEAGKNGCCLLTASCTCFLSYVWIIPSEAKELGILAPCSCSVWIIGGYWGYRWLMYVRICVWGGCHYHYTLPHTQFAISACAPAYSLLQWGARHLVTLKRRSGLFQKGICGLRRRALALTWGDLRRVQTLALHC